MPIVEKDPWRRQYFEGTVCPDDVVIPTDDIEAYRLYPAHRWIYNKLLVAESQGIACAPYGVTPPNFPVFSKPIYNLHGMGIESRVIQTKAEYEQQLRPGHFWLELLTGDHVSTDAALLDGRVVWMRHVRGHPLAGGAFDYWTIEAEDRPELSRYCIAWIERHLDTYSGLLNVESLGGRIFEAHLRFSDQWPDLYGPRWLDAVVELYARNEWIFPETEQRAGYSVVLFAPHGWKVRRPPPQLLAEIRALPDVSSVQITFDENNADNQPMPPGGFRVAIVNAWNLQAGFGARRRLAEALALEVAEP